MPIPVGLLVAGYGISALSKMLASDAQADAMDEAAENSKIRAQRILEKNELQIDMMQKRRTSLLGEQKATAVSMGVSAASSSVMNLAAQSARFMDEQIKIMAKDAEIEASMAMSEAANMVDQAGKVRTAGTLGAIGDVIGLASKFK